MESVVQSMQTIVGDSPILICLDMTDDVLSQGWLAKNKSIMTTFNNIDNIYHIASGNTIFHVETAKDSLCYLSKEQVQQILTYVNNFSQHVKGDITKVFPFSSQRGETLTVCVAASF